MRSVIGALMVVMSTGLILTGLYLSLPSAKDITVIDRPGIPVRMTGEIAQAVAYFESSEDDLELTMIFSDAATHGETMFKTRVLLADGQVHTLAVGGGGSVRVPERFTFTRVGQTVRMTVQPPVTVISAGLGED